MPSIEDSVLTLGSLALDPFSVLVAVEARYDARQALAHGLARQLHQHVAVGAVGQHAEWDLKPALVCTTAAKRSARRVSAEGGFHEQCRIHAGTVGAERAVDAILDDAEDHHRVDILAAQDEVG